MVLPIEQNIELIYNGADNFSYTPSTKELEQFVNIYSEQDAEEFIFECVATSLRKDAETKDSHRIVHGFLDTPCTLLDVVTAASVMQKAVRWHEKLQSITTLDDLSVAEITALDIEVTDYQADQDLIACTTIDTLDAPIYNTYINIEGYNKSINYVLLGTAGIPSNALKPYATSLHILLSDLIERHLTHIWLSLDKNLLPVPFSNHVCGLLWYQLTQSWHTGRLIRCKHCKRLLYTEGERGKPRQYCNNQCRANWNNARSNLVRKIKHRQKLLVTAQGEQAQSLKAEIEALEKELQAYN